MKVTANTFDLKKIGPYNLLKTLGEGGYGHVKLGKHEVTGEEVKTRFVPNENHANNFNIILVND